jgi:hypothetical protein
MRKCDLNAVITDFNGEGKRFTRINTLPIFFSKLGRVEPVMLSVDVVFLS